MAAARLVPDRGIPTIIAFRGFVDWKDIGNRAE
jgi:hypothetical protein